MINILIIFPTQYFEEMLKILISDFFILFFVLLILTPPIFKSHNFPFFLFILNNLKCYMRVTSSFKNHLGTLITTEQHMTNFLSVRELIFVTFSGLFLLNFLSPLLWGS
jgi:hypothetical protein